jgi:hypothetical protein
VRRVPTLILAGLLSVVGPAHLHADSIILSGSGTLSFVNEPNLKFVFPGVSAAVGNPFSVSLSFDPASPEIHQSGPNDVSYRFGPGSVSMNLGTETKKHLSP